MFDENFIPDITVKLYKKMAVAEYMTKDLQKYGYLSITAFKKLVQNKGMFDLKNQPGWKHKKYRFNGDIIAKDGPGNILYGYLGKCFGYSTTILKIGAGYAQISAKTSKWEWINLQSFGDDPRDTKMINLGIKIYKNTHK